MQLKELSLTSPKISPGEILQALEAAIPSQKIEAAIERTQSQHQRNRVLPTPQRGSPNHCNESMVAGFD